MGKKYLVYYKKRPPKVKVLSLERINPIHKKYLKFEEWKGTKRQKELHREVLSRIVTNKLK